MDAGYSHRPLSWNLGGWKFSCGGLEGINEGFGAEGDDCAAANHHPTAGTDSAAVAVSGTNLAPLAPLATKALTESTPLRRGF